MSNNEIANEIQKPKKAMQTTKKVKAIGSVKGFLANSVTGEMEAQDFQVIEVEDRDFNFEKIWVGHIIEALGLIGNAKIQAALWLLKNKDENNYVFITVRELAEKTGTGLATAQRTIQALKEANFLKPMARGGAYQINPEMIFKGSHKKRMNVCIKYRESEPTLPNL